MAVTESTFASHKAATIHDDGSAHLIFVLAATDATVGLGDIWKLPYTVDSNGDGTFVLIYLVAIVLIPLPILIAELAIGRRSQAEDPFPAVRNASVAGGTSPLDRKSLSNKTVILND